MSKASVGALLGLLSAILAGIVLLVLVDLKMVQVSGARQVKTQWEYKIDSVADIGFSSTMDSLGGDGWELVFARRAQGEDKEFSYECIFKRIKIAQ